MWDKTLTLIVLSYNSSNTTFYGLKIDTSLLCIMNYNICKKIYNFFGVFYLFFIYSKRFIEEN